MTRVIQDSDDELDEGNLEGNDGAAIAVGNSPNHQSIEAGTASAVENGTGSTESLKRALATAHRTHLQSQSAPSAPCLSQNQSSGAMSLSPNHRSKRRKTSFDPTTISSPVKTLESVRHNNTYGRSRTWLDGTVMQPNAVAPGGLDMENNVWGLGETALQDYAQHEPMILFPDQSSTIPNATATQERLFAEVMDPGFLGLTRETSPYQPQGSVPWSELIQSPLEQSQDTQRSDNQNIQTNRSNENARAPGSPAKESTGISHTPSATPPAHLSLLKDETTVKESLSNMMFEVNTKMGGGGANGSNVPSSTPPSSNHTTMASNGRDGEDISHEFEKGSNTRRDNKSTTKLKDKKAAAVHSDDDFEPVGLPKEQYKPRPSRSRSSMQTLDETIDYSIRPEKAAKRAARRSKTTGGIDEPAILSTPRKVEKICDMGFTPSTTKRALAKNGGDVTSTIDWLIANASADDHDELAPTDAVNTKRKAEGANVKSRVDSSNHTTQSDANRKDLSSRNLQANDQNGIGGTAATLISEQKKNPRMSSSPKVIIPSPKQARHANHNGELGLQGDEAASVSAPAPGNKKKGRGRPKKATQPAPAAANNEESKQHIVTEVAQSSEQASEMPTPPINIGVETDKASSLDRRTEVDAKKPAAISKPESKPEPKPDHEEHTPTPEKQLTKAAQSPMNNSKVPYRVGLSKRARIAPLLKIMKK